MTDSHTLTTAAATLAYDVRGPLPPRDRPVLMMVAAPMDASGFGSLAAQLPDRTIVTYDPRGLGRSRRHDGSTVHRPEQNAADIHAIISALDVGPVELFASSGGAVSALALVAARPGDVSLLVAHEPPLIALLPDAEQAIAAERAVQEIYRDQGWGHAMAAFIALSSWNGPFPADFLSDGAPDPAAFGLPTDDDGSRDDPLLSGVSNAITAYRPDREALAAAPTRIVVGVGTDSEGLVTGRTSRATADLLGCELVVFPGGHDGFLGGEFGQHGDPEAFARVLREVLDRPSTAGASL